MSLLLVRTALWLAAFILLALAALQDIRVRIIPNRLVLSVAALGLSLGVIERPSALWGSLLLASVLLVGLGMLAHYDILGAGDAKMMAAVTLLVPPEHVAALLLAITMAGGTLSAAYLAMHHTLRTRRRVAADGKTTTYCRWLRDERARIVTGKSVPYAVAILAGIAVYYLSGLL